MEVTGKKMNFKEANEELLVIGLMQGAKFPAELEEYSKLIKKEAFEGKSGQSFSFTRQVRTVLSKEMFAHAGDYKGSEVQQRIALYGLGEEKELILDHFRRMAGTAVRTAKGIKANSFAVFTEQRPFKKEEVAQAIAEAIVLANYKPNFFKSKKEDEWNVKSAVIAIEGVENWISKGVTLGTAQNYTREINEQPANIVTPLRMAEFAKEIGKKNGLSVTVFEKEELKKKGMNGILGVAQGSINPPVLVTMEYNKDKKDLPLYAVVGKGVCFDSGGISIKPSKGMQDMKYDKTGACITLGVMKAVSELKLPIRFLGIFPAVENMPSGTAQRPGDIVKMYNGKTAEVLNTDAEGRVIL
ncbi:hypothetical protein HYT84_03360, partial [Candidatus Micrarchaeota archaeon]|nr:hypothetical protein [Candidatus Micrarchaeota archaeon]